MFANIGDLTSNVISSEKNLPLQAQNSIFKKKNNISGLKMMMKNIAS